MGAEVLLYGYGLVCLSMLAFNLLYSLHLRSDDRRRRRRTEGLRRRVDAQLERLRETRVGAPPPVQVSHLTWTSRCLARVNYLLAFDRLLDEQDQSDSTFQEYIRQLQPVLLYLATVYLRREETQAAYYCHFLARHQLQRHMEMDQIQQVVLSFLRRDSLYCKVNALKALCSFGSPDILADALQELSREESAQLHEKVVTEALLTYTGDRAALIELLWARFDRFSLRLQRAVLDYIRFCSGAWSRPMAQILRDPRQEQGAALFRHPLLRTLSGRGRAAAAAGLCPGPGPAAVGVRRHQRLRPGALSRAGGGGRPAPGHAQPQLVCPLQCLHQPGGTRAHL